MGSLAMLRCLYSQSHAYGYLVLLRLQLYIHDLAYASLMVLGTATVYGIFTISRLWLLSFAKATASILSLTLMAFPTIWCCYGVSSRSRAFGYL
eukprot:scaffold6119_cov172-Skeletonema_marinoi.AAC.1